MLSVLCTGKKILVWFIIYLYIVKSLLIKKEYFNADRNFKSNANWYPQSNVLFQLFPVLVRIFWGFGNQGGYLWQNYKTNHVRRLCTRCFRNMPAHQSIRRTHFKSAGKRCRQNFCPLYPVNWPQNIQLLKNQRPSRFNQKRCKKRFHHCWRNPRQIRKKSRTVRIFKRSCKTFRNYRRKKNQSRFKRRLESNEQL